MEKWYSLIDKIYQPENLTKAFKRVKRNHGAPGIDGETVEDFNVKLEENIEFLHGKLKTNTYEPSPVKRVEIEKLDGGKRLLGIPTVKDRVVQVNIIEGIFDKDFHPSSYGYRPGKSQHKAVAKAEKFLNTYNLTYVADMDLSKCFDTLDHSIIMREVSAKISDGKVLKLIEKFLKAGVYKKMHKKMRQKGITGNGEKMDVCRWKNSKVHIIHLLLPNKYFEELGLIDITTYDVGVLSSFYAG